MNTVGADNEADLALPSISALSKSVSGVGE